MHKRRPPQSRRHFATEARRVAVQSLHEQKKSSKVQYVVLFVAVASLSMNAWLVRPWHAVDGRVEPSVFGTAPCVSASSDVPFKRYYVFGGDAGGCGGGIGVVFFPQPLTIPI